MPFSGHSGEFVRLVIDPSIAFRRFKELRTSTITFSHSIEKPDRVTISNGGVGLASLTRRLDVLPGDVEDLGVVSSKNLAVIHKEWKHKKGAQPTIFGDVIGDGTGNGARPGVRAGEIQQAGTHGRCPCGMTQGTTNA